MGDIFARIADALALVGFRRTFLADFRGKLADTLFVDTVDDDLQGIGNVNRDTVGLRHDDLMGITQVHHKVFALLCGAVAHALDLQLLFEAVGNALHHVADESAGEAVQAAGLLLVIGAGNHYFTILHFGCHHGMDLGIERTLGALHGNVAAIDLDLNARGNDDGFSSNSRHCLCPFLTTQRRELRRQRCSRGPPCPS